MFPNIVSCGTGILSLRNEEHFQHFTVEDSPTVAWSGGYPGSTVRAQIPGIIHEKPGIIPTFQPFLRCKNQDANSANCGHDLSPDRAVLLRKGRNPCFCPHSGDFHRRSPMRILGMSQASVWQSLRMGSCKSQREQYYSGKHSPTVAHLKTPPFSHSGDQVIAKRGHVSTFPGFLPTGWPGQEWPSSSRG